jgi:hypothetical protein
MAELIAAGGWCAPTEHFYDIAHLSPRDWRAKYGWPEDHDPWEYLDDLDIARIADIIENGPPQPAESWDSRRVLSLPDIRVPRGGIRFDQLDHPEDE